MPQKKSWIPPFMYIPNVVHCQCFENSLNCLLRFVWVPNTSTQKQEKMWKSPKLITLHTGFHIHPTYGPRSANEVTSTHGTHDLMSTFCLYFWSDAQMYPKWSLLKIQIVTVNPHICFVSTPSNLTSRFEVDIVLHEEENCHRCANRWMHQVLNGVEGVPRNKFPCHGVQVFSYDICFSGNWSNMKTTPFIQQKNHPHSFCYCWVLLQMSNGLFGYNWTKSGMHDARPHVWKLPFVHVVQASHSFITKSGKKTLMKTARSHIFCLYTVYSNSGFWIYLHKCTSCR